MTNMITRLLSLLKSFSHASNFSSNGFSERAFSLKRGRFEPLEERCLLAVDVAAFAPALADDSNLVVARASEAPDVESAPAIDLGDLTSNATLDDDYVIMRVLDSSTQEDDEDVLAPAFEIDGVPYYSANEIIARQIVFSSADITPNDNLANGTPIILGEGNAADSDISVGEILRSGGGDPETWQIEVVPTLSSSLATICTDVANPLQESRCGGGANNPLANADYLEVQFPSLPYGYAADINLSSNMLQNCSLYVPYGSSYSTLTALQYSGGGSIVYIVPNNNATPESDRVVGLTMSEPYIPGSGGGNIPTYEFDIISASATATIMDDDQWQVTVEATDDTAIERLPGVEPDYGVYAFTREHQRENVPGDTTYPINLEFKTLQTPSYLSSNYQAEYLVDYTLSTTPLQNELSEDYLSAFTYVGSALSYEIHEDIPVLYYHFSGSIPANQTSSQLRLEAIFDCDDEGDMTLPTDEDPSLQLDEIVELTLTRAYWSGSGNDWTGVGEPSSAEVEIKDGAILHLGFETKHGGFEIIDDGEGKLKPNDNDENGNGIEDRYETGADSDLRRLIPRVCFENLSLLNGYSYVISTIVTITGSALAPWLDPTRTTPYDPSVDEIPPLTPDNNDYYDPFWIEGIDVGSGGASISITGSICDEDGEIVEEDVFEEIVSAEIISTKLWADIDIDSMNVGRGFDPLVIPRTEDAEKFENNSFTLGKIMKPFNSVTNPTFYRIVLEIPDDVNLNDATLRLDYPMPGAAPSGGAIRVWNRQYDASNPLNPFSVKEEGGNLVVASGSVDDDNPVIYTPQELGFSDYNRVVTLYVQAVERNWQFVPNFVNVLGRPKTSIIFSISANNQTSQDRVRYVVAGENDYYYKLMVSPALMGAYASELVYSYQNSDNRCLRALNRNEIEEFGFGEVRIQSTGHIAMAELLTLPVSHNTIGLKARLYREYITGKYYITFGGTTFTSIRDWSENAIQALTPSFDPETNNRDVSLYYEMARSMGETFGSYFNSGQSLISRSLFYVTGHSLGGGLASCLSIVADIRAFTYNAAGLNFNSVRPINPETGEFLTPYDFDDSQEFYNLIQRFHSTALIDAYYVDYDPLTYLQVECSSLPVARGLPIRLRSKYNRSNSPETSWSDVAKSLFKCHSISVVIESLEDYIMTQQ